ncbi:hypothetical protein [Komagataeibacter xylinus]|uniref:hypothetical protein n=1 Tax=Komagataeibacter xylinus TaxID=28448 RepID=UPI0013EE810A|nr:hypothetical protein [Komagataeibacter xylinus]
MDAFRTRPAQGPDKPVVKPPSRTLAPARPDTPPAQARPCLSHRLATPAQQPRKSLFRK